MSFHVNQFRSLILRPILKKFDNWSEEAEVLLLGTCAQESAFGTFLGQINGPALGIFQIEPATHHDLYKNYFNYYPKIMDSLRREFGPDIILDKLLITNLQYATLMARFHYQRVKERLPDADDLIGQANYWKKYYNTELGKGSVDEYCENFKHFIGDFI